ncbi:alcohol dehydrogenase catalytic domain-containing protein [Gordonia sp. TBRC 11910]|uniref:Alcohol dehydrogenase catalytic domain-containing protein n=1 Tax=Gordonia asplenii TaxID=2725283 RepID=A0A848KYK5_9ACTN|nr:alcohol dehydrogenase catalytic domain-containing protein [Gordonia asplenii]NMO03770.1 alcohol dehydrogenase catalytic domain-containing protein [Gordonia asplenii]
MKAVTFAGAGTVEVATVADPVLSDAADAVVQVRRAGICGTDLHLIADGDGLTAGTVMGHEFVGVVVDVGAAVRGLSIGDRVAGADFTACGACWWCRAGNQWECRSRSFFGSGTAFGPRLDGAQAEYVRVPFADVTLQKLPPELSWEAALFLGDILATGYAAIRRADFRPGATVAIVGGGPVGQMASQAAQACGAGAVIVVEPVAQRRDLAQECGALAAAPDDARAVIDQFTDGRGADAVVEAVGGSLGLDSALSLVRRRGTVVSVGVHSAAQWPLPVARAFADELTLSFAIGNAIRDRDELAGLLASGVIDPTVVIDGRLDLADAAQGYADMAQRRSVKTILRME